MKRILTLCGFAAMLLMNGAWAQSGDTTATAKAVAALEQQWLQSQRTNNADLLAPLLADNFVQTDSSGKVTISKAAALADAKTTKWTSVVYIDLKVYVFGDTAIAIGGFQGQGTDGSGKALDENVRFTDTWMKMPGGKWQCIASHDGTIKK
jgi:ketosteroid isomerase-like protein